MRFGMGEVALAAAAAAFHAEAWRVVAEESGSFGLGSGVFDTRYSTPLLVPGTCW